MRAHSFLSGTISIFLLKLSTPPAAGDSFAVRWIFKVAAQIKVSEETLITILEEAAPLSVSNLCPGYSDNGISEYPSHCCRYFLVASRHSLELINLAEPYHG